MTSSPLVLSSSSSQSQLNGPIFSASLDTVGPVATLLKAIAFCDKVNLFIRPEGLKWTVEEGKCIQAYILMPNTLFHEFTVHPDVEETCFKIPLKELLECLKIFSSDGKLIDKTTDGDPHHHFLSSTKLALLYQSPGSPFEFVLTETGSKTEFKVKTEEIDNLMDFEMEQDSILFKCAMKADQFFDLMAEVDSNSPYNIQIAAVPRKEMIVISAKGVSGLMEVLIPTSSTVIEYFDCQNSSVAECKAKYRTSILRLAFKALQIGEKLVLKMNNEGLLSLSFLFQTKAESFIEFFCLPSQDDDDEEDLEEPNR